MWTLRRRADTWGLWRGAARPPLAQTERSRKAPFRAGRPPATLSTGQALRPTRRPPAVQAGARRAVRTIRLRVGMRRWEQATRPMRVDRSCSSDLRSRRETTTSQRSWTSSTNRFHPEDSNSTVFRVTNRSGLHAPSRSGPGRRRIVDHQKRAAADGTVVTVSVVSHHGGNPRLLPHRKNHGAVKPLRVPPPLLTVLHKGCYVI